MRAKLIIEIFKMIIAYKKAKDQTELVLELLCSALEESNLDPVAGLEVFDIDI